MSEPTGVRVLPTHTPALFDEAVRVAAERLRAGDVIALPTETVYGLAANAGDAAAVGRIFEIKGRPAHNPVIVHVASVAMARRCVADWPRSAEKLADAFWPGPLTLVLPRALAIPDVVTAGGPTVGVRWPSHPFIQAVIRECGFPLAAPSANRSNELSPTNASHVVKALGDRISLIVDGGQSQVGIESTVVDLSGARACVLRPGMIHEESLAAVLGGQGMATEEGGDAQGGPRRSPGLLPRHYAPRAKLRVCAWRDEMELRSVLTELGACPERTHLLAHSVIPLWPGLGRVCVIPHDPEAFARALYAELHRCDEEGAEWIIVEALPEGMAWRGIADRLKRAVADTR